MPREIVIGTTHTFKQTKCPYICLRTTREQSIANQPINQFIRSPCVKNKRQPRQYNQMCLACTQSVALRRSSLHRHKVPHTQRSVGSSSSSCISRIEATMQSGNPAIWPKPGSQCICVWNNAFDVHTKKRCFVLFVLSDCDNRAAKGHMMLR